VKGTPGAISCGLLPRNSTILLMRFEPLRPIKKGGPFSLQRFDSPLARALRTRGGGKQETRAFRANTSAASTVSTSSRESVRRNREPSVETTRPRSSKSGANLESLRDTRVLT